MRQVANPDPEVRFNGSVIGRFFYPRLDLTCRSEFAAERDSNANK
jgi:hypothetical protein